MPGEFDRDADILTDEIIDRHLGGGPATAVTDEPHEPAADDDIPEDEFEETSDEEPEDEDEDTDDDDAGEDELEDELEDEDEDEDEDDEEDEEEEDVLDDHVTAEDHERIKADPSLAKVHRQMQKAFTKKTMELSERTHAVEQRETRAQGFLDAISTPEGMAKHLASTLERRPEIVGAAFEAVATGENAEAFLLEVGLHDPTLFERAFDRLQELQGDEQELARHKRQREASSREAKIADREQKLRRQQFDRDYGRVQVAVERAAKRLGIDKDDMGAVSDRLKVRIRERVRDDGSIDLSTAEVKEIVADAKEALDKVYEKARRRLELKETTKSRKDTKRKAARAKQPGRRPPRAKPTRTPKTKGRFKPPEGRDPLDAFVDHRLAQ